MSLKAFHIVFVLATTLVAFAVGGWELKTYFATEENAALFFGVGSIAAGVALIWYGKVVLKKLKHISYL